MRWFLPVLLIHAALIAQQPERAAMARDVAKDYEASHLFSKDSLLVEYVEYLADKLAPGTAIAVVRDTGVRAAACPSGKIYLTTALIARTSNEAALAGVIAHEIEHQRTPVSGNVVTGDSESGVCARFAAMHTVNPPAGERGRELMADEAAQKMLLQAGYDPSAMVEFFSKLRHEDRGLPQSFSAEDLLLEKLQLEADPPRGKNLFLNTSEFENVHARVRYAYRRRIPLPSSMMVSGGRCTITPSSRPSASTMPLSLTRTVFFRLAGAMDAA